MNYFSSFSLLLADKKLHSTEKTGKMYQKNRGTNIRGKMTSEMLCRIENSSSITKPDTIRPICLTNLHVQR